MEEAHACKAGLAEFKSANLTSLQTDLSAFQSELAEQTEVNTQDIVAEIDGLKESYDTVAEVDALEDFIYDLADIRPNPNGYGRSHADGVQPYGRWVANRLEQSIANFGQDTLSAFRNTIDVTLGDINTVTTTTVTTVEGESFTSSQTMDALTTSVQDMLINMREGFENSLLESVMRLEEQATAGREQDQIALVTTKNNLWKELSWVVRESLQSGRRSGYSSGPFTGLLNLA